MAKNKFEAKIGADTSEFEKKVDDLDDSFDKFGKSAALSIGGVMTAATAAATVMLNWAKDTEWGLALMNKGLAKTKQLIQDIMAGTRGRGNVERAGEIADAMSKEEADRSKNEYIVTGMETEIKNLQTQAASTKILAEKKELLNKALEKEAELKAFLLSNAKTDLKNANDQWEINLGNVDARNKAYEAAKKVKEIEGMDSRFLAGQYATVLQQEADRAYELAEAFREVEDSIEDLKKKYGPFWAEIEQLQNLPQNNQPKSVFEKKTYGLSKPLENLIQPYSGTNDQNKANEMAANVQDLSSGLTESQLALMDLSSQFASFFTDVDNGFQGMIQGVINGIAKLVAELLAKAAILAILSAITGVPMPGLKSIMSPSLNILNDTMGGGTGLASGMIPVASGGGQQLVATLRGKDIDISLKRFNG